MTLVFTQGHDCVSNLTDVVIVISRTIFKVMAFKLFSRIMYGIYNCVHARFDDLDFGTRSQWVGVAETNSALKYFDS